MNVSQDANTTTSNTHTTISKEKNVPNEKHANSDCLDEEKRLLTIWYTNADTLTKDKLIELTNEINQENAPDVICITEFKPKNFSRTLTEVEYKIEGYEFVQEGIDKVTTRGVAIYINNSINFVRLDLANLLHSDDVNNEL